MTKLLMATCLLVVSSLTAACSDNEKEQHAKEEMKFDPQNLTSEQQKELEKRAERSSKKGNILDNYNPDAQEQKN